MAIALVSGGAVSSSLSPSFGQATTAGNFLVAYVACNSASATDPFSVATGTGWVHVVTAGTAFDWVGIFCKPNCGAGETAPTFNPAGTGAPFSMLAEFSGVATASPLDQSGVTASSASNPSATCTAVDTVAGDLIISSAYWNGSNAGPTTLTSVIKDSNGTSLSVTAYNNASTTGTVFQDFSWAVAGGTLGASADFSQDTLGVFANGFIALASFKPAAGAAPAPPDVPAITPGPTWLDLFKPGLPKPRPALAALPAVAASGSFPLGALAFTASGGSTFPDAPRASPGPTWLDLFKPGVPKPRPPVPPAWTAAVTATGSFPLGALGLSGQAGQSSPDVQQLRPGPVWLDLFKPGLAKPRPVPPALPAVATSGAIALGALAFQAQGAQTGPDVPAVQPGLLWLRLFRPWQSRPLPPVPATPAVGTSGSFALGALSFTAQGGQSSPDQQQIQPGPVWQRLLRPWAARPVPPPAASGGITSSGTFTLSSLGFAATAAQTSPDYPAVLPGPVWLDLFKPGLPRIRPFLAQQPPFGVQAAGNITLGALGFAGTAAQTSPDTPRAQPGLTWQRLLRPWQPQPLPPLPGTAAVAASGSFPLAPLALSGEAGQSSPDQQQVQPGPLWLRLLRPWVPHPLPPVPGTQAAAAAGSLTLGPLAFAGAATVIAPAPGDLPLIAPGPTWLRLFVRQARQLAPVLRVAPAVSITIRTGDPRTQWVTGDPQTQWQTGG